MTAFTLFAFSINTFGTGLFLGCALERMRDNKPCGNDLYRTAFHVMLAVTVWAARK